MKINLCYGKLNNYTFDNLIEQFNDNNFKRPTRSTIPLLEYWRNSEKRLINLLNYLSNQINIPKERFYNLSFEYSVNSYNHNKSSFTDLMIYSDNIAIAIESKYMEGRYETVEKWLKKGNSNNKVSVLQHWIELINPDNVQRDLILELPYQLIHRTASACFLKKEYTFVIYQIFKDNNKKLNRFYNEDLKNFKSNLNNNIFFCIHEIFIESLYDEKSIKEIANNNNLVQFIKHNLKSSNKFYKIINDKNFMVIR